MFFSFFVSESWLTDDRLTVPYTSSGEGEKENMAGEKVFAPVCLVHRCAWKRMENFSGERCVLLVFNLLVWPSVFLRGCLHRNSKNTTVKGERWAAVANVACLAGAVCFIYVYVACAIPSTTCWQGRILPKHGLLASQGHRRR